MCGRILQTLILVLVCYVAAQKPGAMTEEANSSDLVNKLHRLEAINERNIQDLEAQLSDLQSQLEKQNEINNMQAEVIAEQAACKASQAEIHTQITEQSDRIDDVQLENQEKTLGEPSDHDFDTVTGNLTSADSWHTEFVGFSAWKQTVQNYTSGDIITFEGVLLNEGSHFSPALSRFTCPLQGVYYITVTYRKNGSNYMDMLVYRGNDLVLQSYNDDNQWNIISASCLVSCSPGEHIYVQGGDPGSVYGDISVPYTSFSVFLLYSQDSQRNEVGYHNSAAGYSLYRNIGESLNNGDVVTFPIEQYNDGNYALNRYVCPATGIYYLSATLQQSGTAPLYVGVKQDTITVLSYSDTDNHLNTHTNSRLIRCEKNDTIAVHTTGDCYVPFHSYITAMLMQEEEPCSVSQEARHNSFIGFTAYKTITQSYEVGEIISFGAVPIDEGSHYSRILNRFVCPVDGIYLVSVNLMKNHLVDIEVDVKIESYTLFRLADSTGNYTDNTLSNTVIVRCLPDWSIQVVGVTAGDVYGDHTLNFSTFTVMQLQQT